MRLSDILSLADFEEIFKHNPRVDFPIPEPHRGQHVAVNIVGHLVAAALAVAQKVIVHLTHHV